MISEKKREEIERFIQFMSQHKDEDMLYEGDFGLLITKSCNGELKSGCCSKQYDLEALFEVLKEAD